MAHALQAAASSPLTPDTLDAREQLDATVQRLPSPHSPLERLILRGLLVECACRIGSGAPYVAAARETQGALALRHAERLVQLCARGRHDPIAAFGGWIDAFFADLEAERPPALAHAAARRIRQTTPHPVRVSDLARQLGATPGQLRRAFRQEFGCSVKQYEVRARLLDALAQDDLGKIEALAAHAGYRSRKDLYRGCKQTLGVSLMEFRRLPLTARRAVLQRCRASLGPAAATRSVVPSGSAAARRDR